MTAAPTTPTLLDVPHGLRRGVSNDVYHQRVLGLASKSALDHVHRSPAHYKAWIDGVLDEEETAALRFGSAFHCRILEPHIFARTYAIAPDFGDCRFKEAKNARDAWRAKNAGKRPLSAEDGARLNGMAQAIERHALASRMLASGENELTVRWRDPATGIECKSRLDSYRREHRMAIDLKSTTNASPDGFRRSVTEYRYHVQDAFYRGGLEVLGEPIEHFLFIVVEKDPPHGVAIYSLDAAGLDRAREHNAKDLARLAECLASNTWPAYAACIETIALPPWAS